MDDDLRPLNHLRAQYRTRWHAYRVIARGNAVLLKDGRQPTSERLIDEQRAVEAVKVARSELLAAIRHLAH